MKKLFIKYDWNISHLSVKYTSNFPRLLKMWKIWETVVAKKNQEKTDETGLLKVYKTAKDIKQI